MRNMYVKKFNEINKNHVDLAGGKGASLGEMTNAGIPVPKGYVVLSNAYEEFIDANSLRKKIDMVIASVDYNDHEQVEEASRKIRGMISNGKIPSRLKQQVVDEFFKLGAKFVAVRSSATAEDSSEAAWAGQLESYLNTTKANLMENVKKCWSSLFTPRAIFYRLEKGLHGKKISVAVVVQQMIDSDVSGVAFSVHPVSKNEKHVLIEAVFGLGEAIVSGVVSPDSYIVTKDGVMEEIKLAEQEKALVRSVNGGNVWKYVDNSFVQKLGGNKILELAELIKMIENHYGFACDIKWAFADGEFFITQSRPITTL